MGCTESATDNPNKVKPILQSMSSRVVEDSSNILLGEIDNNEFFYGNVHLPPNEPPSITKKPLPHYIPTAEHPKLRLPNFGQLIRIADSQLYLLTGGINYSLEDIYASVYVLNAREHRLTRLMDMRQGRYIHSAVYYGGHVYVVGGRYYGQDEEALLTSCERLLIDFKERDSDEANEVAISMAKNSWEVLPTMNIKRCSNILLVYEDRLYALGGYTGEFQRSTTIEYLNLKQPQAPWNNLKVQLPFGIQSCVATWCRSNELILLGGNTNSGASDVVLHVDLTAGRQCVRAGRKMQASRVLHKGYDLRHSAAGRVSMLILGGNEDLEMEEYNFWENEDEDAETKHKLVQSKIQQKMLGKLFNSSSQFQSLTSHSPSLIIPFAQPLAEPIKATKTDQLVYIFGTSTQPFILQLNITAPYALQHPMPLSIRLHALQGIIYVEQTQEHLIFGGISDSQEDVSGQVFIYNKNSPQKSQRVGCMVTARYAFASVRLGDWVYAIGGGAADQQGDLLILSQCERLNLKKLLQGGQRTDIGWEAVADLPFGVISGMAFTSNSRLYVFGGMKGSKQRNQSMFRYVEHTNTWEELKFKFTFGLEGSSLYKVSETEFLIFGGRVVNGDTKGIWGLSLIEDGNDCVFQQKGQMNQSKCLHHVYKPHNQNFFVVLGGQKQVLSYYDYQTLKIIDSDILVGMKKLFEHSLSALNDATLKNYTVVMNS